MPTLSRSQNPATIKPSASSSTTACIAVPEADLRQLIDRSPADGAVGVGHSGKGWAVKVEGGYLVAAVISAPGVEEWGVWLAHGVRPLAGPIRALNATAEAMTAWPRDRDVDTQPVEACLP